MQLTNKEEKYRAAVNLSRSNVQGLSYIKLTLRELSLFFKIIPIATLLHIFWPPFTFSTPNLAPFPTYLPGLESPQALHRIKSNAVLSLF